MMGLFTTATNAVKGAAGKPPSSGEEKPPSDTEADETSILDENEGSIITHMVSQLRVGMDLSKVSFPTFVLEPRSMLERITDFMAHPDLIFGAENVGDPDERFIKVLQYYLAGWHIKPKGVKKPYNPVLGEFFRCRYEYPDGSRGFYIAEQISHHPPISAFFYTSPANKLTIIGELRPKSKFLGNSVSTQMDGENRVILHGRPEDGEYVVSMPNMYARGILFGKMVLELGDMIYVKNEKLGITADIEFKTKGFFSGTYNAISGKVKHKSTEVGTVDGKWSGTMEYKSSKSGDRRTLFNVSKDGAKVAAKVVPPESEQEPNESRRLWQNLTIALGNRDQDAAQTAKSEVEERERDLRRKREAEGKPHVPRFFEQRNGRWEPKITLPADPEQAIAAAQAFIWPSAPAQQAAPQQ